MAYTEAEVEILKTYDDNIDELALQLGKSKRSIIGKLSRMKLYVKKEYKTKAGLNPVSKLELVHIISEALELDLEGLEAAPKQPLQRLAEWARNIRCS